jgi:hypothetical protein
VSSVLRFGRCVVCSKVRRLADDGCAECVAQFGEQFVVLAKRVRSDARFRELCWRALAPSLQVLFIQYFGAVEGRVPNSARTEVERNE